MTCSEAEPPSAALERLKAERLDNPSGPSSVPSRLPLSAVNAEPAAFQVRAEGLSPCRVEEIALDLDGSKLDEPIHVWWSGKRWIVIEGHHRHAAYLLKQEQDGRVFSIPVIAHPEITLGEALGAAGRMNDREKVRISKAEKLDNAWRIVCMGEGSIRQQSANTGAHQNTITNMRKVKRTLQERRMPDAQMMDAGWKQSREWANGKAYRDHSPDALEVMAQAMAEELGKLKVTTALKSPEVLARAIEILSPALPARLLGSDPFWSALNTTGRELLSEVDEEEGEQTCPSEEEPLPF